MVIWNILRPFGIFYGHLVMFFVVIWYLFSRFWYVEVKNLATLSLSSGNLKSTYLTYKHKVDYFRRLGLFWINLIALNISVKYPKQSTVTSKVPLPQLIIRNLN
jgi:hypothetical protein